MTFASASMRRRSLNRKRSATASSSIWTRTAGSSASKCWVCASGFPTRICRGWMSRWR